jgi:D-cysteine desulfhydrase
MLDLKLDFTQIVCASGSSGTHAGLLTGFVGNNFHIPIIGISVSRRKKEQETVVYDLVQKLSKHVGVTNDISKDTVTVFDEYVGEGYSIPTEGMVEAVQLFASYEGLLLDPVYTGKAAAGLIGLICKGYFSKNDKVLFVHTGGAPALYAYTDVLHKQYPCNETQSK